MVNSLSLGEYKSNVHIHTNEGATINRILYGDLFARMASKKDPGKRATYEKQGIIGASPAVTEFIVGHKTVFANGKLYNKDGSNFLDGLLKTSIMRKPEEQEASIRSILKFSYGMKDQEIADIMPFFSDLNNLAKNPDLRPVLSDSERYKQVIESNWKRNEKRIMRHVFEILGYVPKDIGQVDVYIVSPTINTHRSYPESSKKTYLFLGKPRTEDQYKILAYLTHQAVHQPMLPYRPSMTGKQRVLYHAFIKFLADKETYHMLTGKSYLDIVTEKENAEAMGKVYPYWLGYLYRNAAKEGVNPEEAIRQAIARDKEYYSRIPEGTRKKKLFSKYNFDMIDPAKVAQYFKARRAITPYEFADIDFSDTTPVYRDKYLVEDYREGK